MRTVEKDENGIVLNSVHYGRHGSCKHCGRPLVLDEEHFAEVNMSQIAGSTLGIFTRHAFLCDSCFQEFYESIASFFGYPNIVRERKI